MAEQIVELAPGESKQVSFEAIPSAAKTYNVSVDGLTGSFKAIAPPSVDLVVGVFTFHSVNGIPFSRIDSDGYAVLARPLVLNSLGPLSVNFTYKGYPNDTRDSGSTLFCGLWWTPDFTPSNPAFAPPFYTKYVEVPLSPPRYPGPDYIGSDPGPWYKWLSPFTMTVNINELSNAGYGPYPRGNWIATIKIICPGGGPGAGFAVKGIVLQ